MKNWLLYLFFGACSILIGQEQKYVYPVEVMISYADVIVEGAIVDVKNRSYEFHVTEQIKGNVDGKLKVIKFKEWRYDQRWAPHRAGQQMVLFLKRGLFGWKIINGSTGEIPVINGGIYLRYENFCQKDKRAELAPVKISDFKKTVETFLTHYELKGSPNLYPPMFITPSDRNARLFKYRSRFSVWLMMKMQTYQRV